MGIVKKQAFQNSIIQYLGILLGYVNVVVLFPKILDSDQFGLTRIFFAIAALYVTLGALGSFRISVKFFPFFKRHFENRNGIFILSFGICVVGFAIVTLLFLIFKDSILSNYAEQSSLLIDHYYLIVPLSFSMMLFQLLESFLVAVKKTVTSGFLKNVGIRLLYMLEITLYYFGWIDFEVFLLTFVYTYAAVVVVLLVEVLRDSDIKFPLSAIQVPRRVIRVIFNYGFFTIITGISNLLVNRIDIVMVTFMLGLSDTAVYSIASYISSVIAVPMQSISRIASPIVAHDWKAKRLDKIQELYKKSSISQLILGGWIFVCIWVNIDEIFTFFPKEYSNGKYAVFFIGLSVLYNMTTGINASIIILTKFYRWDTYATIALTFLTIFTNWLLIPTYGIQGAALATLISIFLYNTFKFLLLWFKLKMQPYSKHTIVVTILLLSLGYLCTFLPEIPNHFFMTIVYKSAALSLLYFVILFFTKSFPEMNLEVSKLLKRIKS